MDIFGATNKWLGAEIPRGFPTKYTSDMKDVGIFNANMSWDVDELTLWHKRHGIEMKARPLAIYSEYVGPKRMRIYSTLVEHPSVPDAQQYVRCSIVLQRAVIVFDGRNEDLYLRSYFYSSKDANNYESFVPSGAVLISFDADTIWYPLSLTEVIDEPASKLVLDVLTKNPVQFDKLPYSLRATRSAKVSYHGDTYYATRIEGELKAGVTYDDLELKPRGKRRDQKE